MKCLVTGGAGFLAGRIVEMLQRRGHEVRVLVRRPLPGIQQVLGTLESRVSVFEAVRGCEWVFHAAAKAGVWGEWREYHSANVLGTQNVLEACRAYGVQKLIYTSSPSVTFGGKDCKGGDESLPYPENFLSYYSETKAMAEQMVLGADGLDGLSTVALRPHLIYGPGDPHIVPRLLRAHGKGRLKQIGDGQNLVDVTFVDNAAHAHILAAEKGWGGKAYFVSDGSPVRLWDWVERLLSGLGRGPVPGQVSVETAMSLGRLLEWTYRTLRLPGEPPMTRFTACSLGLSHYYSIEAARRDLGYEPVISADEGFQRLLDSLRS